MKLFPLLSLLVVFFGAASADDRLQIARQSLKANRIFTGPLETSDNYKQLYKKVSARPDPNSKFGYIVFSIARHHKKLLTTEQSKELESLIESRQNASVNWHDNRNIVRIHAVFALWKYAAATESAEVAKLKSNWEAWTDLRIDYMFEEFIAKERFQTKAWQILTAAQQEQLLSGAWDQYLKKSTGHGRLYSAPKQVSRELGKPDHPELFAQTAEKWRAAWQPMLAEYNSASQFQRKREFSLNLAGEPFAAASWSDYAKAFRAFVTMERDAIRELVQSGYDINPDLEEKLAKTEAKFRDGMIRKYSGKSGIILPFPE